MRCLCPPASRTATAASSAASWHSDFIVGSDFALHAGAGSGRTEPGADDLRRVHAGHREAANRLRLYVREFGGEPSQSSQTWGAFAKAVEGVAKLFGNRAAIKALKAGEERGAANYEEALENEHLPA